jgi:hypothetical protein
MGLREKILAANERQPLRVPVKDWGCDVGIRVISVGERDAWEATCLRMREKGDMKHFRSTYLAFVLCDPDTGVRLFKDSELDVVEQLDGAVAGMLMERALEHNKITEADVLQLAGECTPVR